MLIKAGVLEIADVFAVNKADREGADHTVMALQMMQGLAPSPQSHHRPSSAPGHAHPGAQPDGSWLPPIVKTVAMRGEGVDGLAGWIEQHGDHLRATGQLSRREEGRAANTLDHILRDRLLAELTARLPQGHLGRVASAIARREQDPYSAVDELLAAYGCP